MSLSIWHSYRFLFSFFFSHFSFSEKNNFKIRNYLQEGFLFSIGFFLPPILLYLFFNFNFIRLIQIILHEVPHVHTRSYPTWLFYNLYDFFVFIGIPLAIIFFIQGKLLFSKYNKQTFFKKIDPLFLAFCITLLILDLSGSTRGETREKMLKIMQLLDQVSLVVTKVFSHRCVSA